jgi:hypothetical protein
MNLLEDQGKCKIVFLSPCRSIYRPITSSYSSATLPIGLPPNSSWDSASLQEEPVDMPSFLKNNVNKNYTSFAKAQPQRSNNLKIYDK